MDKHVHCEVIKAYAEGIPIEQFNGFTQHWMEVRGWTPEFSKDTDYRIKPGFEPLDYKALLKKYMAHVRHWDGSDYVEFINTSPLSKEEQDELIRLSEEPLDE